MLGFEDISFWEHFLKGAPIEAVIELAGDLISAITNLRIKEDVFFFLTAEHGEQNRLFKHHWTSPSLLTIMWFLFYLEITGQMTQKYKICSFCSEPIFPEEGKEKVHGKRKFHEGCRQKHNEFAKNRAISMHKEGKNITEIINEFPDIKKETIFRWISANKG